MLSNNSLSNMKSCGKMINPNRLYTIFKIQKKFTVPQVKRHKLCCYTNSPNVMRGEYILKYMYIIQWDVILLHRNDMIQDDLDLLTACIHADVLFIIVHIVVSMCMKLEKATQPLIKFSMYMYMYIQCNLTWIRDSQCEFQTRDKMYVIYG